MNNKYVERVYNGLLKENPTFILLLGMCPTLAVTTSAINGLGMGLSTTLVLVFSNLIISLLRNIIPNKVRVPAFIVVVASLVTIVQFLLEGFIPSLYSALGLYIPLIVVNCIILGRAESFASKNKPGVSFFDGVGMGLGFTFALTCIGLVREIMGSGQAFGIQILPLADSSAGIRGFTPFTIFVLAPGAFFVLAFLIAIQNAFREHRRKMGMKVKEPQGCLAGDCASCQEGVCLDPDKKQIFLAGEQEAKAVEAKEPAQAEEKAVEAKEPAQAEAKAVDEKEPAETENTVTKATEKTDADDEEPAEETAKPESSETATDTSDKTEE